MLYEAYILGCIEESSLPEDRKQVLSFFYESKCEEYNKTINLLSNVGKSYHKDSFTVYQDFFHASHHINIINREELDYFMNIVKGKLGIIDSVSVLE